MVEENVLLSLASPVPDMLLDLAKTASNRVACHEEERVA